MCGDGCVGCPTCRPSKGIATSSDRPTPRPADQIPSLAQKLEKLAYCGHDREMSAEERIAHEALSPIQRLVNECDEFRESCAECRERLKTISDGHALLLQDQRQEAETLRWHPIETAPKDGTRIIAWGPEMQVAECEWLKQMSWTPFVVGWYRTNQFPQVHPTHWLPLPPSPIK